MAIQTGQKITPALLRRLRPAIYTVSASGDLNGAATTADIPGCSITFTTETAGASWLAEGYFDADNLGAVTALMLGYCDVDGVIQTGQAPCGDEVATDRHSASQVWSGAFAAAGVHTIKLKGTVAANQSFRTGNTRLTVTIQEVV